MGCKVDQHQRASEFDELECSRFGVELHDLVSPGVLDVASTDDLLDHDLFECTSVDSDWSFYEIDTNGNKTFLLDLETGEEFLVQSIFSKTSSESHKDQDRRRYRAWIGARSLHLS